MTARVLALAAMQALLNGIGVAIVKNAMARGGSEGLGLFATLLKPRCVAGATLIAVGFLATAKVVAETRLSVAIPVMAAMSFLFTAAIASLAFRERVTWHTVLGMALIVAGASLLARRAGAAPIPPTEPTAFRR